MDKKGENMTSFEEEFPSLEQRLAIYTDETREVVA